MKSKINTKEIPEYLPRLISGRAVPLGFNLPKNRYPFPVAIRSDCTSARIFFYEYHGLYWYSVTVESRGTFNSTPFLSMQNCICAFRSFLHGYGFVCVDNGFAETSLRLLRRKVTPHPSEV